MAAAILHNLRRQWSSQRGVGIVLAPAWPRARSSNWYPSWSLSGLTFITFDICPCHLSSLVCSRPLNTDLGISFSVTPLPETSLPPPSMSSFGSASMCVDLRLSFTLLDLALWSDMTCKLMFKQPPDPYRNSCFHAVLRRCSQQLCFNPVLSNRSVKQ